MRWPFRRQDRAEKVTRDRQDENGIAAGDYVDQRLAWHWHYAHGREARTAATETAANLFARCMASATVTPGSGPSQAVTPGIIGDAARRLVLKGEAVYAIEVRAGRVVALPTSGHIVELGGIDSDSWRYRVDLTGPSGNMVRDVGGAGVLHFVWHRAPHEPFTGQGPIDLAGASTELHSSIVATLDSASNPALRGQAVTVETIADGSRVALAIDDFAKARTILERMYGAPGGLPLPMIPPGLEIGSLDRNGATPAEVALLTATTEGILSSCGISPALFAATGDGSGQREAFRRLWATAILPLGKTMEEEIRRKLDPAASISFPDLRAQDEDGRSRAVARRANAFKTLRDAGVAEAEAKRLAGLGGDA